MNSAPEFGPGFIFRRRRRLLRAPAVLMAALIIAIGGTVVAASPASAATTRCVKEPAGWGGVDTFEVCTTVGINLVTSLVKFFTSRYRPGPQHLYLANNLYKNDVGSGDVTVECIPAPGPGSACSFTRIACNPVGTQKWYTVGGYREDYAGHIIVETATTPPQWESVGGSC